MGLIFNHKTHMQYEKWISKNHNMHAQQQIQDLMLGLLSPQPRDTILEVGCGAGDDLIPFIDHNLNVSGIEPSAEMRQIIRDKIQNKAHVYDGYAESLPCDDNEFNYVFFKNSLEFIENPQKAINEACRVAKDKIFISVINRISLLSMSLYFQNLYFETIFKNARFYTLWELKKMIRIAVGDVPLYWGGIGAGMGGASELMFLTKILQKNPIASYLNYLIVPIPRFRTRPLSLSVSGKQAVNGATGALAKDYKSKTTFRGGTK